MAGTIKRLAGPLALTTTYTTNVHNPSSALVDHVIRHIHIANKTGIASSFRLFLGATGGNVAGTELFYDQAVAANDVFDYYGALRLSSSDFLVGGAADATALTITIEGEAVAV